MWFDLFIQVLLNIIEIALWLFLTGNLLTFRRKRSTIYVTAVLVFILYEICAFSISDVNLYRVAVFATFIAATVYLYSEKILIKILSYLVHVAIMLIPEVIIVSIILLLDMSADQINNNTLLFISSAISFIIVVCVTKLFKREKIEADKYFSRTLYIMLGVSFISVVVILFIFGDYTEIESNYNISFSIIAIIFCFELVLCITLIYKMSKKSKEIIENNKKIQMLESKVRLNTQIEISEANLRAIRHNISNTFGIVKGLINTQSYEELNEYMAGIISDIQDANEIIFLENKALSVLINNKSAIAKTYGIDFKSIISICTIRNMSNSDLCSLMGNIWDNAIEAAKEAEDIKYIRTTMQAAGSEYIITCENTYKYEPIFQNNVFISRKKRKSTGISEEHGIGTKNIKAIVEKYKGSLTNTFSEGEFRLRIVWPIEKVDEHSVKIME